MKCLVTGAAGYIGGSLVKRLIQEGYDVKALIHKTKPKNYEKKAEYVEGDIGDFDTINHILKDIDIVIHCAAYVKDYGSKKTFFRINVDGTKNLVTASKTNAVKRFVFLSHITYESTKRFGFYSETKAIAEEFLLNEYTKNKFPVTIIRPGNVYGPGATLWVIRNIESIRKRRITLVDNGNGIFLHTYIDNLLDAIIASIKEPNAVGKGFNITDGDHSITFGRYFNDLAKLIGEKPIKRNLSKNKAMLIGKMMILLNKIFKIKPWVTPTAVNIITNQEKISIEKSKKILKYTPKINYAEGMKQIKKWLENESYVEA